MVQTGQGAGGRGCGSGADGVTVGTEKRGRGWWAIRAIKAVVTGLWKPQSLVTSVSGSLMENKTPWKTTPKYRRVCWIPRGLVFLQPCSFPRLWCFPEA